MSLQINKIYKVKEGHEGKCGVYKYHSGKYILITKRDREGNFYKILGKDNKFIGWICGCFTEDDLEPIEEENSKLIICHKHQSVSNGGCVICKEEEKLGIRFSTGEDGKYVETQDKEKSIHNLEVRDGYQKLTDYLFSRGHSITKPLIDDIWVYLKAETLLEEKLVFKLKD